MNGNSFFQNTDALKPIVASLTANHEDLFRYYDLSEGFDVTLNFIQKDSKIDPHTHENTVFNYVFQGAFEVNMSGHSQNLKPGEWIQIPRGTSHSVHALEDTVLLELWQK